MRIGFVTVARTYRFSPYLDHFTFGYEMARIARALVTGYGYSDPFSGHTGPTAWVPPLYPLLIAAVFKVFGIYSAASGWVMLALNSVFSAATTLAVYEIAARCYNRKVAIWSAWIWALYPAAMQYAVRWVWETPLSTFLLAAVLVLALRMRTVGEPPDSAENQSTKRWLIFGLLWALIAMSNSTMLLFLPVCGLWILFGARERKIAMLRVTAAAIVFLACIAPWVVRNWIAFHTFVPMRSKF